ncbi:hypothetical protein AAY473_021626 [Plecturocebus cupreus]
MQYQDGHEVRKQQKREDTGRERRGPAPQTAQICCFLQGAFLGFNCSPRPVARLAPASVSTHLAPKILTLLSRLECSGTICLPGSTDSPALASQTGEQFCFLRTEEEAASPRWPMQILGVFAQRKLLAFLLP